MNDRKKRKRKKKKESHYLIPSRLTGGDHSHHPIPSHPSIRSFIPRLGQEWPCDKVVVRSFPSKVFVRMDVEPRRSAMSGSSSESSRKSVSPVVDCRNVRTGVSSSNRERQSSVLLSVDHVNPGADGNPDDDIHRGSIPRRGG